MNETKHTTFKKRAAAIAVASCLSFAPWIAEAASLGKLTVLSGLGQPLRAELDIGAGKDEISGMTARLAPQDAFKQAGIDFATALLDLRFAVEQRSNGQAVVKVSSSRPINEPFLDLLVELNWPTGRLVREYTFLLDPPEIALKQAARPVAEARVVETVRGGGASGEVLAAPRVAPRMAGAVRGNGTPRTDSAETRVVQAGETLRKIAGETKHEGVTLEQMLVGLFQKNPDAFIGQNVNRLKAGAILNVPDATAVAAVSEADAKKIYVTQAGDWNAYRRKLAATTAKAPAQETAAEQSSAGKITAKVEEKAAPAEQMRDQVKVSRSESNAQAGKGGDVAEQLAKDKALKEAQERVALLEKNVVELQKLLEMKNQRLAELQQATQQKEVSQPVAPAQVLKPEEAPKPAEPVASEASKPVEAAPAAPEVKPAEPTPAPPPPEKPKVVVPPPAPVEEPSFIDTLLADPLPLAGGGGILALLATYFVLKRRRQESATAETTAAPMPSNLGPNSVFRMTGGQSIDTGNTPPQTGDFSQTGPGTIDTDEVDPVAEADVYMAYGRDTQAEEILLEALQKDTQRTAIHAKLLEIYANRRSIKQFETLASELYALTAGVGADWEKVARLGAMLDPANPLYNTSAQAVPEVASPEVSETSEAVESIARPEPEEFASSEPVLEATPLPELPAMESAAPIASESPVEVQASPASVEPASAAFAVDDMTLDFDLGTQAIADDKNVAAEPLAEPTSLPESSQEEGLDTGALDFDISGFSSPAVLEEAVPNAALAVPEVDFDLSVEVPVSEPVVEAEAFSPDATLVVGEDNQGIEASFEIDQLEPEAPAPAASPFSDLDLTLDLHTAAPAMQDVKDVASAFAADSGVGEASVDSSAVDADAMEFDVKLSDAMFLGTPMPNPDFDIGSINLDLSVEPEPEPVPEPVVDGEAVPAISPEPALEPSAEPIANPAVNDVQWEEVNTKLDLAKAYEEMGDLEGARELLQEVVGEGPVDLVEQARAILARIGG